jgi:hypothetical protein
MKTIIFLLIILIPIFSYSQAVDKKDIEIGIGAGFGIYGTSDNNPDSDTTDENNMAAAGLLDISIHYAILKNFSIGILAERNGYLTNRDSSNRGVSLNLGLDCQYRLMNREKTLIFGEIFGGYSNFRYDNLSYHEYVTGNGFCFQLGIGFKHYFSKTVGMFIQSNYALYQYKKLVDSKNNILKTGPVNDQKDYGIKMSGLNLKLGLTFHF